MLLNIRLLVYRKQFHKLSQKAGNFGAGGLKNLRAGGLWGPGVFTCIRTVSAVISVIISNTNSVRGYYKPEGVLH